MAEPGDEIDARGRSRLRASHADREQVIDVLKAAFVHGRVDKDEFDLRVGQALASRTCAELAVLTTDIPAGPIGTQLPAPIRKSVNKKALVAVGCATPALLGMIKVATITPDGSPFGP